MTNQTRFNVGYAIAAIFLVFMIQYAVSVANQMAPIPYSDFQRCCTKARSPPLACQTAS